jgi:hypothetical protein
MSKVWFFIVTVIILLAGAFGISALTKAGIESTDLRFILNLVLGFIWGSIVGRTAFYIYEDKYGF